MNISRFIHSSLLNWYVILDCNSIHELKKKEKRNVSRELCCNKNLSLTINTNYSPNNSHETNLPSTTNIRNVTIHYTTYP